MNEPNKLEKAYSMGGMAAAIKLVRDYLDTLEKSIEEEIKKLGEDNETL